jgi:beta-catenin-like protein 1
LDVVLAWLAAVDGGARKRIVEGLRDRDEGLDTLKKSLQGQLEEVDTEEEGNVAEMLTALIECL